LLQPVNLLILDEPTNHLDIKTKDILKDALKAFDGTLILVSHDRDFLDRTVTLTLGLDGSGHVDIIAGGYADWEAKRDKRDKPAAKKADKAPARPEASSDTAPAKRVKLTYKDQRDYDLLPSRIAEIDAEVAAAEKEMGEPTLYTKNPARFAELTAKTEKLRAEKDAAEERWLELAMMVEEAAT
jgi:ATP-binding cassette subfamily F protein uup